MGARNLEETISVFAMCLSIVRNGGMLRMPPLLTHISPPLMFNGLQPMEINTRTFLAISPTDELALPQYYNGVQGNKCYLKV